MGLVSRRPYNAPFFTPVFEFVLICSFFVVFNMEFLNNTETWLQVLQPSGWAMMNAGYDYGAVIAVLISGIAAVVAGLLLWAYPMKWRAMMAAAVNLLACFFCVANSVTWYQEYAQTSVLTPQLANYTDYKFKVSLYVQAGCAVVFLLVAIYYASLYFQISKAVTQRALANVPYASQADRNPASRRGAVVAIVENQQTTSKRMNAHHADQRIMFHEVSKQVVWGEEGSSPTNSDTQKSPESAPTTKRKSFFSRFERKKPVVYNSKHITEDGLSE